MLHFFRRLKLFGNTGLNVGKTGVSVSKRGRAGSVGTDGFTVKTGVKGLGFRFKWSTLFNLLFKR